ncbi:hypothetical protein [Terrabacter sp. NPDC000476]|uniref:hypothetical protein n=1 Tax=Terrabacter sp. NPDC000476 TaxID=3154258 RepID=UPI0033327AE9
MSATQPINGAVLLLLAGIMLVGVWAFLSHTPRARNAEKVVQRGDRRSAQQIAWAAASGIPLHIVFPCARCGLRRLRKDVDPAEATRLMNDPDGLICDQCVAAEIARLEEELA